MLCEFLKDSAAAAFILFPSQEGSEMQLTFPPRNYYHA